MPYHIKYVCNICGCNFIAKSDYDAHMDAFGFDLLIHSALFKIIHFENVKQEFIDRYNKIEGRIQKSRLGE